MKMLHNKFLNTEYTPLIKALTLAVLVAFSFTLNSCETYYLKNYTPEQFETDEYARNGEILELKTKDSVINAKMYGLRYVEKTKTISSFFMLEKIDSVLAKDSKLKAYRIIKNVSDLKLSDVSSIKVEQSKFDAGKTFMWTGIVIGSLVALFLLAWIIDPPKLGGL